MPTARTTGRIVLTTFRIATHTVKNRLPPFRLKSRMVPAIIIDPQHQEKHRKQEAINKGTGGEIEHAEWAD